MFRVIIVTGIIGGSFGVVRHFLHISFILIFIRALVTELILMW